MPIWRSVAQGPNLFLKSLYTVSFKSWQSWRVRHHSTSYFVVHPIFVHPIFSTSYFWCFLFLRSPSCIPLNTNEYYSIAKYHRIQCNNTVEYHHNPVCYPRCYIHLRWRFFIYLESNPWSHQTGEAVYQMSQRCFI